jgi:hypothetical protein
LVERVVGEGREGHGMRLQRVVEEGGGWEGCGRVIEMVRGGNTAKRFLVGVVEEESGRESYGGWLETFVEGRFSGPWKGVLARVTERVVEGVEEGRGEGVRGPLRGVMARVMERVAEGGW